MFGVFSTVLPAQLIASNRCWSVIMNNRFGLRFSAAQTFGCPYAKTSPDKQTPAKNGL
jgi:hypothetical protein